MVYVDFHACLDLTIPSVIGYSFVFLFASVIVSNTEVIACRLVDLEDLNAFSRIGLCQDSLLVML